MNIVDFIILALIIFGGIRGFKSGFTRSIVSAVGMIVIVILAFLLKNPVSVILYENLPFFDFGGIIKGVTVLNIALYELLAFVIVLAVLGIILKILTLVTSIFEKILTMTIILGIPSKILGAVVGVLQWFVIVFIGLYILNMPMFNIKEIEESKLTDGILERTPILSGIIDDTTKVIDEFMVLKDNYKNKEVTPTEFNRETLDLFLKYDVIKPESVDKLVSKGKLKIENVNEILDKYREGK